MNITVTNQIKNDLLSRNEVEATINFDGPTPSRVKVLKEVSEAIKAKPETVIIKQILTEYGKSFAKVKAYAYKDEETMTRLERKNLIEKHSVKKEEKKEEVKPEEPAAEAPVEKDTSVEEKAPENKKDAEKKEAN